LVEIEDLLFGYRGQEIACVTWEVANPLVAIRMSLRQSGQ